MTQHNQNRKLFLLLAAGLFALISGCQSNPLTPQKHDGQVTKADVLVPTDPALDQAEAEFENQILAQIPQESHLISQIKNAPRELLWDQIADDFELIKDHREEYKSYMDFYLRNAKHLERVSVRAKPYLYFIYEEIKAREMPMELAMLPIIESAYYPYSKSRMRAAGLWQFIPSTGRIYGLKQDWWYDGRQDVYLSTHAALDFLQSLYVQNNQDWLLAIASYNAGFGRIQQAIKRLKAEKPREEINFWTVRPYLPTETRHYVPQLLAVSDLIKNRHQHGLNIEAIPNEPYLRYVELGRQFDLKTAAKMLEISPDLIKHLNPGYLNSVTPPDGPHHLLVPLEKHDKFAQAIASNNDLFSIRWKRHYIVNGDSLSTIAHRYKTSTREIQRLNNISGHTIRAGRTLLIPIPSNQPIQLAEKKPKAKPSKSAHLHRVQRGESLWTIAHYYGVETTELAGWNNINPQQPIRIGQTLEVFSDKYGHLVQHYVKDGESLWLIARRYNTTVQDITRWNQLNSKKVLRPGNKLNIWLAQK